MNALSESQARAALAGLRSETVDEAGVEVALGRLLRDLPPSPACRRLLVPALGLGAIGVAILLVLGLTLGTGNHHRDQLLPGATPAPALPYGALASGLTGVTSLVDAGGALWASGIRPDAAHDLVRVQIGSRKATDSLLVNPANGLSVTVDHLATVGGQVFGVTADGSVEHFTAAGDLRRMVSAADLGSSAEALAASPGTGLWMLSCCGAAPAGQGLVQQRDTSSLAAVGLPREFAPFGGLLAAGPAGVWFLDGDSGEIRRVSSADTPAEDPVVETDDGRIPHDLLAVSDTGPVLARQSELLTVNGATLAVQRTPLPAGLPAPTALTVVGGSAYVAFPQRVVRYDLSSLTESGSYPLTGVTALTAGPDGVWAATGSRLVRVDSLPELPPAPTAYRKIPTGLNGVDSLVDAQARSRTRSSAIASVISTKDPPSPSRVSRR